MARERGPFPWLLVLALVACRSAPSQRVDRDVLERISIENKLLLFDAENELNIAIDARDQVVDELEQLKEDLRRVRLKQNVAERDVQVFGDKGDVERAKVAALRAEAAEAQHEFLQARLAWARERLARERQKLIVAKAKFELAKATLVKKNNVPGASEIELSDFEAQVSSYAGEVGEYDADVTEAEAEMKTREGEWVARAKALQAATGGALGSRWLD